MAMRRRIALVGIGAVLALGTLAGSAGAHVPTPIGEQGCTPGFWKSNLLAWESTAPNVYLPTTLVGSVFTSAHAPFASMTFLQVLQYGGNSMEGKLLKQAVAGLLSTVHFDVAYPIGTESVLIAMVNAALATNNASVMEALKDQLDDWNNLGCPLSANVDY
jgi:hypothetical protein